MGVEYRLPGLFAKLAVGLGRCLGTVAGLFEFDDRFPHRVRRVVLSGRLVGLLVELPNNGD